MDTTKVPFCRLIKESMFKNKQKIIYFLLGIIVLFAAFLRFYNVSNVPVSLYWDEAADGYNAYSIALTGKDEFGIPFPLLFKSFEDYKTPGNIYLTSFAVRIFGLNEFSVRFTSCLAGTLTVFIIFFLLKELLLVEKFSKMELFKKKIDINGNVLGLLASFFLAISPWHLQFSRAGFEANVALAFVVTGVWLLLRSIRLHKQYNFYYASILFAISFYFYRTLWVFLPLLLVSLLFFLRQHLFTKVQLRITLVGVALFFLILSPFIPVMISPLGMQRGNQVSVFTGSTDILNNAAKERLKSPLSNILYNQHIVYAEILLGNYLSQFSPQFLFISGDPQGRHGVRSMGVLYLWEIPFLLFGLYILLFKMGNTLKGIIISWILLAPIPVALTLPVPHALRGLNILPMPQILTAVGVYAVYFLISRKWKFVYISLITIIITGFFTYYLYLYYAVTAKATSADWADGYKQLTEYMIPRENRYEKLAVTGHYWKPYIYFLFYKSYDPAIFQAEHGNEYHFGKYVFSGTSWGGQKELDNINLQQFAGAKHILVAMSPGEYVTQKNTLHYLTTIKNHNNETVFIVGDMGK